MNEILDDACRVVLRGCVSHQGLYDCTLLIYITVVDYLRVFHAGTGVSLLTGVPSEDAEDIYCCTSVAA